MYYIGHSGTILRCNYKIYSLLAKSLSNTTVAEASELSQDASEPLSDGSKLKKKIRGRGHIPRPPQILWHMAIAPPPTVTLKIFSPKLNIPDRTLVILTGNYTPKSAKTLYLERV